MSSLFLTLTGSLVCYFHWFSRTYTLCLYYRLCHFVFIGQFFLPFKIKHFYLSASFIFRTNARISKISKIWARKWRSFYVTRFLVQPIHRYMRLREECAWQLWIWDLVLKNLYACFTFGKFSCIMYPLCSSVSEDHCLKIIVHLISVYSKGNVY